MTERRRSEVRYSTLGFVSQDEPKYRVWENASRTVGVELDADGMWLRTREHPADMWGPPEQMTEATPVRGGDDV
jgi:hypothetical protein